MTLYYKKGNPPDGTELTHSVYCGKCGRYFGVEGSDSMDEMPDVCPWGCDAHD